VHVLSDYAIGYEVCNLRQYSGINIRQYRGINASTSTSSTACTSECCIQALPSLAQYSTRAIVIMTPPCMCSMVRLRNRREEGGW
jgi:hypothetical protein